MSTARESSAPARALGYCPILLAPPCTPGVLSQPLCFAAPQRPPFRSYSQPAHPALLFHPSALPASAHPPQTHGTPSWPVLWLTLKSHLSMMSMILYCWLTSLSSIRFFRAFIWSLRFTSNSFLSALPSRAPPACSYHAPTLSLHQPSRTIPVPSVLHRVPEGWVGVPKPG